MTDETDVRSRFREIAVGRTGGRRAPYKPLLVLWTIGRCLRGEPRLTPYERTDRALARLIGRFGPHGRSTSTHYPFWRMTEDRVWELDRPGLVRTTKSGDPFKEDLRNHKIRGGLTEADYTAFRRNPDLAHRIADSLVAEHFPPGLQEEVLEETLGPLSDRRAEEAKNRNPWILTKRRRRDPGFRNRVLEAYDNQCAVCAFSARLLGRPLALEAAHIRWHECEGPAVVGNGLALCALHHHLFDSGAFTILPDLEVRVAREIRGAGTDRALGQYDGRALRAPLHEQTAQPDPQFLLWHGREVFRNPEGPDPLWHGQEVFRNPEGPDPFAERCADRDA